MRKKKKEPILDVILELRTIEKAIDGSCNALLRATIYPKTRQVYIMSAFQSLYGIKEWSKEGLEKILEKLENDQKRKGKLE